MKTQYQHGYYHTHVASKDATTMLDLKLNMLCVIGHLHNHPH